MEKKVKLTPIKIIIKKVFIIEFLRFNLNIKDHQRETPVKIPKTAPSLKT
jgi:hypothetical protein